MPAPTLTRTLDRWSKPALALAAWLFLTVWLVNTVTVAYLIGYDFNGAVSDGPFQLFNPLRRLLAGQIAGRDFQFFHGIGIPFLHYPLFRLLGGTLAASETARQLVSPLVTVAALLIGWRLVSGRWRAAIMLAGISAAVLDFGPAANLYAFNSLMAARSFAPVIACAALAWDTSRWRAGALVGVSAALALPLGTEHGLTLAAALAAGVVMEWIFGGSRTIRDRALPAVLAGAVTLAVVMLAITHGELRSVVAIARFNLVELGEDQFWYFGADPVSYITRWSQFLSAPIPPLILSFKVVLIAWVLWRRRRGADRLLDAGFVFLLYGALTMTSLLAIYSNAIGPYLKTDALFLIGLLYFASIRSERFLWRSVLPAAGALFCLVDILVNPLHRPLHPSITNTFAQLENAQTAAPSLPRISPMWQQTLDVFHEQWPGSTPPKLWSTYAGMPELDWGLLHPDTDYIIHALGLKRRQAYYDTFDRVRPDLVQTEVGSIFHFEGWVQSTSWPLYDRLLRGYVPAALTPHSIVWRPRRDGDDTVAFGAWQALTPRGEGVFLLPPAPGPMAVVRLRYEVEVSGIWKPIAKRLTRFVVDIQHSRNEDRVPLNPRLSETTFPVHYRAGETPELHVDAAGLFPGGRIRVLQAEVSLLTMGPAFAAFAESGLRGGDTPGAWRRSHVTAP